MTRTGRATHERSHASEERLDRSRHLDVDLGGPHHVAIYVGGDRILHAPRTGDVVRYGTIGEFSGEVMTVRRLG